MCGRIANGDAYVCSEVTGKGDALRTGFASQIEGLFLHGDWPSASSQSCPELKRQRLSIAKCINKDNEGERKDVLVSDGKSPLRTAFTSGMLSPASNPSICPISMYVLCACHRHHEA